LTFTEFLNRLSEGSRAKKKKKKEKKMLDNKTIEKLSTRKGVKTIAVQNFLGTLGSMTSSECYANCEQDTRDYCWNAATVKAIRDGISLNFKR